MQIPQIPTHYAARRVGPDTDLLESYVPLPGLGVLPVNAYVIRSREPVLVDTGMAGLRDDVMRELRSLIDLADLRWIWLTHVDADHVGNLAAVLAAAPRARVVTNYLGAGKLGLQQLPLDRVYLLNPGQSLAVGDRALQALRPPVYDAPETMAAFDTRTRHLFSSDCFGAVLSARYEEADDVPMQELAAGMARWAGIDAPWLAQLDPLRWSERLDVVRALDPSAVMGSHLPVSRIGLETLLRNLQRAVELDEFVGPDQAAVERLAA